ncbi:MAG: DedA family protein [Rhodobacterales bacterium]|nr:DedA family protein [Rhodobacterales bacterium]NCT11569.1 DedA family protein [Rhodobacterales bacterium]
MTEQLLELIPVYGVWLMFGVTFFSCLALPVPASIVMLTAGGLAASGDLAIDEVALGAFVGAVIGDQAGYALGRRGAERLIARLRARPARAAVIDRAFTLLQRRGRLGVFLSRWLFSPLGPWINFAAGASAMPWRAFTLAGLAGETVWVGLYVGLGYGFADRVVALSQIGGTLTGALAAGAVALALGLSLHRTMLARRRGGDLTV